MRLENLQLEPNITIYLWTILVILLKVSFFKSWRFEYVYHQYWGPYYIPIYIHIILKTF